MVVLFSRPNNNELPHGSGPVCSYPAQPLYNHQSIAVMLTNTKNLSPRDIAEIEWFDTHSTDRLTQEELDDLEDSYPTVAYGLVLKNSLRYITIASEIRMDQDSDGTWVEQIPHAAIRKARKLGQRNPHKT